MCYSCAVTVYPHLAYPTSHMVFIKSYKTLPQRKEERKKERTKRNKQTNKQETQTDK